MKELEIRTELGDGFCRLRQSRLDDAGPMFDAIRASLPELCRFSWWCRPDYAREEAETFLASCGESWLRDREYFFVIEDPATGLFLGGCSINQIDRLNLRANVGYWVRSSHHHRGIAAAATRFLADFGFADLGLERLEIIAETENLPSRRVAEKAGFIQEGLLRHRLRRQDRQFDALIFARVRDDE